MLILITGGSKCGKSSMAEKIIMQYDCKRYYIATMEPFGNEAEEAILRHRSMRAGKRFETIERYRDVGGLALSENSAILLECVANLCANEMFVGESPDAELLILRILEDVKRLADGAAVFVAVTSQVGGDGIRYARETMAYMELLGAVNAGLARMADVVIESVYGLPLFLKGEIEIGGKG